MVRFTLLGSFHGHNAGDDAILSGTLSSFRKFIPQSEFNVISARPHLLEGKFSANIVASAPKNLCINILGIPGFRSVIQSHAILITQAIVFDMKLWNPAFNYLWALNTFVPYAKNRNKPVICYNVGLGPLRTLFGKKMARRVLEKVDLIILRQTDSVEVIKTLKLSNKKIMIGADPALDSKPVDKIKARELLNEIGINSSKPVIGINLCGYLDKFIKPGSITKAKFIHEIVAACNQLTKSIDLQILFIVTNAKYDKRLTFETIKQLKIDNLFYIDNTKYHHDEIQGIQGLLDVFVGMRLHSIILASSVITPVIALPYQDKVIDYMNRLNMNDKMIFLDDLSGKFLAEQILTTIDQKNKIKKVIKEKTNEMREKLLESTKEATKFLYEQFRRRN